MKQQDRIITAAVGGALLCLLVALFWNKLLHDDFSGDGIQAFYLSRSLLHGFLPNWSLENGYTGFEAGFMLFAYPNALLMHLLGPGELAVRIPFLLYLLLIYFLAAKLVSRPPAALETAARRIEACVFVAISVLFAALLFGYYASYQPYFADLAEPATTDIFFTLLLFISVHALASRAYTRFVIANLAMTLALPSGPLWVAILTFSAALNLKESRKKMVACFAAFVAGYAVLQLLYFGYREIHPMGPVSELSWTALLLRIGGRIQSLDAADLYFALKYTLLSCAVMPVLAVFAYRRLDPFARFLLLAGLLYAAATLAMGANLHYFTPYAFLAPVAFHRFVGRLESDRSRIALRLATLASTALLVVLIWPDTGSAYQRNSEIAKRTVILFESEEEALSKVDRMASRFFLPHRLRADNQDYWGLSPWVWMYYASRDGSESGHGGSYRGIDYVFANQEMELAGFTPLYHEADNWLYLRDVDGFLADLTRATEKSFLPPLLDDARPFKSNSVRLRLRSFQLYSETLNRLRALPATPERTKVMAFLRARIEVLHGQLRRAQIEAVAPRG